MTAPSPETDFPVNFDDPADAEICWRYDPVHMPAPLAPLEFELGTQRFLEGFGWGMVPRQINYFTYFAMTGERPSAPDGPVTPAAVREGVRRWHEEALPEILRHTERYRVAPFDTMTNEELAHEVELLPGLRFRSGQLHTQALKPHWDGMTLLMSTYKELIGGDDLSAMRLVQGYENKSFEAGERLWRVSQIATRLPVVRDWLLSLEEPRALQSLAELRQDASASAFVEAFDTYLDEYGWRGAGGFASVTWFEDPTVPLMLLRAQVQTEDYDPDREKRRLIEERKAALSETLAALDGEARKRFEEIGAVALDVAPLLEDHNFFLDQRLYLMPRRLILSAARRLEERGSLGKAQDVFFLHADELITALRGSSADLDAIAAQRKQEYARWKQVTPPPYVGAPPPESAPPEVAPETSPVPDEVLAGTGASPGIARGSARVLRSLSEAGRLGAGDVLVTSVTQPSWTPLFAVAGAVVTEVGGMLSHTAVAAREYGIPAVVAVRDATRLLHDGQLVEVDGSAGVVRVIG